MENSTYISKKQAFRFPSTEKFDSEIIITIEYHIGYNISYGVPILCFNAWKQGTNVILDE